MQIDDRSESQAKQSADKNGKSSHYMSSKLRFDNSSEFKKQTFYALESIRKGNIVSKICGITLFVLIVANAIAVLFSAQPDINVVADEVVEIFFVFSTVCFAIEYVARIWISDLVFGSRTCGQARVKYILSPMGIIDLLSFAPGVISWILPVAPAFMHAIGVLRLIRLAKITRYMRGFRTIGRVFRKYYREIVASFLVIVLLIIASSVVMFEIEHPVQPDKFTDLLSGVWWAVETVTGTGYGDIAPITPLGRILGSIIMLLSLALVAIPGGIFSAGFVAEFQNAGFRRVEWGAAKRQSKDASEDAPEYTSEDASK